MCLPSGKCNRAVYLKEVIFLEPASWNRKVQSSLQEKKRERERDRVTVTVPEGSSLANRSANCLQCSSGVERLCYNSNLCLRNSLL